MEEEGKVRVGGDPLGGEGLEGLVEGKEVGGEEGEEVGEGEVLP